MNDTIKKEINLLDLQTIITLLYIGSLILSIYITSIDKDTIINPYKKHPNTINLSVFNRLLVLLLTLGFLYIGFENKKLASLKGKKLDLFSLQITASELSTLATLIVLYVVIKSAGENYSVIAGIENPGL